MGHWRSWERATLAVWRSRVRIPYAPFFVAENFCQKALKIKVLGTFLIIGMNTDLFTLHVGPVDKP